MVEEVLAEGIARARWGDGLAVVCVELDRFGLVVDAMGQEVAEHLLRAAADRLIDVAAPGMIIARNSSWGFTVTAPVPDTGATDDLVGLVRRALGAPLAALGREVHVTCSVGVRLYFGDDPVTPEALVRDADGARRAGALEHGLGSVRVFDTELHGRIARRLALEADLRRALDAEAFEVAYQPQLDIATGQPVGLEALARWWNGDAYVPPPVFIPIAEETGLIVELGQQILGKVATDLAAWRDAGVLTDERVAVNLSARQLDDGGIDDLVLEVLQHHDLPTTALTLEVTESTVMTADPGGLAALARLHDCGVTISVDDFGTGYSSLATLKALRLGEVKIDRSFVEGVERDADDAAICSAVLGLASSLGLGVVAEGVEDTGQARTLQAMGCTVAQGYLYSRPVPADDVPATLDALRTSPLIVDELPDAGG
jgi:predicted signal transduction protein with EAL and GGDEF domain